MVDDFKVVSLRNISPNVQEVVFKDSQGINHLALSIDKELSETNCVVDKLDISSRAIKCEETHNKLIKELEEYLERDKAPMMKIIDWETKGNVIRFYLGKEDEMDYYGDDWDDASFLHNAGLVYGNYIEGVAEIYVPFGCVVHNPTDDRQVITKEDFKDMKYPCLIVTDTHEVLYDLEDYQKYAEMEPEYSHARYFYLNDRLEPGTYVLSEDVKELKKI